MNLQIETHATQKGGFVNVTLCSDPLVAFTLHPHECDEWARQLRAASREAKALFAAHPKLKVRR
jgi:hypothetical protein